MRKTPRGLASQHASLHKALPERQGQIMAGRIVVVTGASRGIGRASAVELVRQGEIVIGTGRTVDACAGTVGDAHGLPGRFIPKALEMTDESDIFAFAHWIEDEFGHLDVLFGNAGILGPRKRVATLTQEDWHYPLAINVTATYLLLHCFDGMLKRAKAGRVLFVTSGVSYKRHPGWIPYAAGKAAIEAIIGVYANEIADTAIRANCLSPGPIHTDLRVDAWPDEDHKTIPTPDDLAPYAVACLSPEVTQNGCIYDFKTKRWMRHVPPEPMTPESMP
jgi:NAD(P)-dependent dehydrogenase (short-subunit alcohol dehydrogenase family)